MGFKMVTLASNGLNQSFCEISLRNLAFLNCNLSSWRNPVQSAFTCSKLTIETLEQGMKYVQSVYMF